MKLVLAFLILAVTSGCSEAKDPVAPTDVPLTQRAAYITIVDRATGQGVPSAVLHGYSDAKPYVTWDLICEKDGTGKWMLYDGTWHWTVQAPGYANLNVTMYLSATNTTFRYEVTK